MDREHGYKALILNSWRQFAIRECQVFFRYWTPHPVSEQLIHRAVEEVLDLCYSQIYELKTSRLIRDYPMDYVRMAAIARVSLYLGRGGSPGIHKPN